MTTEVPTAAPLSADLLKLNPRANVFAADVSIYELDPEGKPLKDADGKPIAKRPIGRFVFRVPTLKDRMEIGVRRAEALRGQQENVDFETVLIAEILATLPLVTTEKPEGWDWQALLLSDFEAATAVWREFTVGLERFRENHQGPR